MNGANGTLDFDVVIKTTDFKRQMDEIERRVSQMNTRSAGEVDKLSASFSNLGKMAGAYLAFDQLKGLPSQIIAVRGEFQQLSSAFNVMLGSKEKGDKLFQDAVQFASKTPFTLQDVGKSAKQLLAYGTAAGSVVSDLKTLGDVAAGVGAPIQDLVYLYGTLRTQGKAMTVDIRQFAGRGIPIYAELAKVLGVAKESVASMVEQGKVGFPEVEKAFQNMTKEGGQFNNMMAEQSKSLTGLMSNLQDAVSRMFNDIGTENETFLADGIKGITSLVNNYKDFEKAIGAIVIAYGSYRAASILVAIANTAQITSLIAFTTTTDAAVLAQLRLNTAIVANPYILLATAIIGVIAYMVIFRDKTNEIEKAHKRFEEALIDVNKQVEIENKQVEASLKIIKNKNLSLAERNKHLEFLKDINPKILNGLTLENIETAKGTKILSENSFELDKQIQLKALNAKLDIASGVFKKNRAKNASLPSKSSSYYDPNLGGNISITGSNELNMASALDVVNLARQRDKILNSKFDGGDAKTFSPTGIPKKEKVVKEAKEVEDEIAKFWDEVLKEQETALENYYKNQQQKLDSFLQNVVGSPDQLAEISKKYDGFIEALNNNYSNKDNEEYKRKLKVINDGKNAELKAIQEVIDKKEDPNFTKSLNLFKVTGQESKTLNESLNVANQLANVLSSVGKTGLSSVIGNLAGQFKQIQQIFSKSASFKGETALNIASVGLTVAGSIVSYIQKQKAEKEAYYASVIQLQRDYNLELNNQLLLENKSSLIGNIVGQYKGNFDLIKKAKSDFQKIVDEVSRKTVGPRKDLQRNPFDELKKQFPELFDSKGNLNTSIAEKVISSGLFFPINDELKSLVELQKQINNSKEQIDQLTTSIGGSLEGTLRNTLVKAFEDGSDAALAFGGDVSKVLEDISSQILFQAVFADSFKKLKTDLDIAFQNGDTDLSQEFGALLAGNTQRIEQFNSGLSQLQTQGAVYGLNLFQKTTTSSGSSTDQLSGSIKGVSEQTASVVAGQMNAMRITQALMNSTLMQNTEYAKQTAENTLAIKNLMGSNGLRSVGL